MIALLFYVNQMLHNLRMVLGLLDKSPRKYASDVKQMQQNLKQKGTPDGVGLSTGLRARGFRQFFEVLGIIIFHFNFALWVQFFVLSGLKVLAKWKIYTN
ncbi:hypothetical protein [Glaesserella parasuis]|uniref:hypothetical protein n=1 Tax=Glaesserella parasuis TaxID=738 RepID=UPI00047921F7|nr:hypothetical protein [Glaesserella parasuis]